MGAIGSTGTTAANALAAEADLVIGVGTRWSDFTTASRTAFQNEGVRFVNINIARFDAGKHAGLSVVADAREALTALATAFEGYAVEPAYRERQAALWAEWDAQVEAAYHPPAEVTDALAEGLLTQGEVLGAVNELTDPRDVVLCAAGSMPGDLHKLWRVRDRKAYHVEYGYSCMGYEVPASIGIRLADESRDVFADGRRRRLPHDADRAGHRRAGAREGHRRPGAEPRVPLDRLALGVARLAAVRHEVPLPRREERPARGGAAARGPRRQRPQPRRPRHRGALPGRPRAGRQGGRRRRPPTAARSSSTSRPTPRSTPRTAKRGGTCRSARSPSSTAPEPPTPSTPSTSRASARCWHPPPPPTSARGPTRDERTTTREAGQRP